MTTCPNCKAKLSCGCQKRTASNGVSVCSSCVSSYEAKIKQAKGPSPNNAPTNITTSFIRGKQT